MGFPWSETINVTAAGFSAIATGGAWLAASRSNATAVAVARIERERWHAELTPQFEISIERTSDERKTLDVQLVGPLPIGHLDEVAISITDDDLDRTVAHQSPPTQEQVDAHVWGPFKFVRSVDGADTDGRTVRPIPLLVGHGRPFNIERTRPPVWQTGEGADTLWQNQYRGTPMRLVLTCRLAGHEPWVIPYAIDNPDLGIGSLG